MGNVQEVTVGNVKALGMTVMAMLVIGGFATTVARAALTEGPLLVAATQVLGNGETRELTGDATRSFTLKNKALEFKVECGALELESGATLNGSSRETSGGGKETIGFSSCSGGESKEGSSGCEPEGGKITTNALIDTLGYSGLRSGPVLVLFKPESGSTFALAKFTGAKCAGSSVPLNGSVVGELLAEGSPVEVGKNEVESLEPEIEVNSGTATILTESAGTLTSTKGGLTIDGVTAPIEGAAGLELVGAQLFGALPRPMFVGDGYSFTPELLAFHKKAGLTLAFTIEDVGSNTLELEHTSIVGGEAKNWLLTDTNLCTVKTFVSLGHCLLTIELMNASSGDALLEGLVRFGDGHEEHFTAKALLN